MVLETTPCPNCGSSACNVWGRENGFTAVQCRNCTLIYVNPRPSEEAITEANKIGVHATESGAMSVVFRRSSAKIGAYSRRIGAMFSQEIKEGRPLRWLDVGAGFGETIEAAMAVLPSGSDVSGIELMAPKVRAAQERGLPISETSLSDLTGPYDVISLINVFSHIPDFKSFGRQIVDLLARDGVLWLETGNLSDIKRAEFPDRLYLPDHLVFAGPKPMTEILGALGLKVEATHAERYDTPAVALKGFIKAALDRRMQVRLPYTSPFRTVFYKARRS